VVARAAIASASRRVDFPEPFSPTKIVIGRSRTSSRSSAIAGTLHGKPARSGSFADASAAGVERVVRVTRRR
jgi:hypothetical protein